jgi:hypothetical protein
LICYGAGGGIRTRDPNLGKVVLYQLSYTRIAFPAFNCANITKWSFLVNRKVFYHGLRKIRDIPITIIEGAILFERTIPSVLITLKSAL